MFGELARVPELARHCSRRHGSFFQELFFAVNQRIDIVSGQLKTVAVGDGVGRAGLHAIAAENAP